MTYVYNNEVYEVDLVVGDEYDESEIFLVHGDTRESISVYDLPANVQDELWAATSDLMVDEISARTDWDYEMLKDNQEGDDQ